MLARKDLIEIHLCSKVTQARKDLIEIHISSFDLNNANIILILNVCTYLMKLVYLIENDKLSLG